MRKMHFAVSALAIVGALFLGFYIGKGNTLPESGGSQDLQESDKPEEPKILYWVAPMDPDFRRDEPGKSPMGMDLVAVYAGLGATDDEVDVVRISPAVENNLGVRTDEVLVRPLWRRVQATGYVGFDESRMSRIHMRTEGWVETLAVDTVGERVVKGQLLFEFYSPALVNAQKEFLQAGRRGETSIFNAAREKLAALGMGRSEVEALEQRGSASKTVQVLAPRDGIVTALNAREGMFLKPESEVISLADLSEVWMLAEVFEAQADWVVEGQSAEARLDYLPGEVFSGRVDYVYPVLDPKTRTLRVRLRFDNPGERLKPNMYADVTIFGRTHQDALTIPRDALIRAQDYDRVIVALGEGRYRAQEVMTGLESGEWVQIIAGLESGQQVVTSAQFLIDSESSLTGSLRRLEPLVQQEIASGEQTVFGSGIIESINRDGQSLVIRHGPIDTLGWPGMTMKFVATSEVDLSRVKVGQNVHFSIVPDTQGTYLVDMIHLVESSSQKIEPREKGKDHD